MLRSLPARYYRMYPREHMLGHCVEKLDIPLGAAVLLLVWIPRNGMISPASGTERRADLQAGSSGPTIERIAAARQTAEAVGMTVIEVTSAASRNPIGAAPGEAQFARAWPRTSRPRPDEAVIEAPFSSAFFSTPLDASLRALGARTLLFAGGDGLGGLGMTALDALYRNYRVIGLRDAIFTREYPETSEGGWAQFAAVRQFETATGYTATVADFIEAAGGYRRAEL